MTKRGLPTIRAGRECITPPTGCRSRHPRLSVTANERTRGSGTAALGGRLVEANRDGAEGGRLPDLSAEASVRALRAGSAYLSQLTGGRRSQIHSLDAAAAAPSRCTAIYDGSRKMTTKRTYECNLCRSSVRDGVGRGFKFGNRRLDWTTIQDAENHLCDPCVEAFATAIRDSGVVEQLRRAGAA